MLHEARAIDGVNREPTADEIIAHLRLKASY